ncbi:MAG: hypothetical protein P1U85_12420 [Verrucomicrobiales bacterium]|nr:hypothetical protein [Verrucomicrobiales bacterium]
MINWIVRIVAVFLLAAGLAGLLFPFPDFRLESVQVEVAVAKKIGFSETPREAWQPEEEETKRFPAQVLALLEDDSFEGSRTLREPGENVDSFLPLEAFRVADSSFLLLYRDRLFRIRNQVGYQRAFAEKYGAQVAEDLPEIVKVTWLGKRFPPGTGLLISPESMRKVPGLQVLFEGAAGDEIFSLEDWRRFAGPDATLAEYKGEVFEIRGEERIVDRRQAVDGLQTGRRVGGGILVAVGLILLTKLYRQGAGFRGAIRVGSAGQQMAGDAVVVVLSAIAFVPWIDLAFHRVFLVEAIADEEFGRWMGGFFLLVGVPAVSLYLSTIGSQWVAIDGDSIVLKSPGRGGRITWSDLESIESKKSYLATVRVGVPLPRTFQKSLVFTSREKRRLAVMEPTERVKREILGRLKRHAPDSWQQAIDRAGEQWLGYESW